MGVLATTATAVGSQLEVREHYDGGDDVESTPFLTSTRNTSTASTTTPPPPPPPPLARAPQIFKNENFTLLTQAKWLQLFVDRYLVIRAHKVPDSDWQFPYL